MRNRGVRLLALLFAMGLLASACGDDGGGSAEAANESPESTEETEETSTTTTEPVEQELSTGDVQVTLRWPAGNADIVVLAPEGDVVARATGSAAEPSATGGQIEGDDTGPCSESGPLVTRTFWPDGEAPSGDYQASVRVFSGCDGPIDYTLEVEVLGEAVATDSGSVSNGETSTPISFEVP